jgi:hypothetical protein
LTQVRGSFDPVGGAGDNPGMQIQRRSWVLGLGLAIGLLASACGGGGDGDSGDQAPVDAGEEAQVGEVAALTRTEAQDRRELGTLVEAFFFALASGDDDTVWSLITRELQAEVERSDVRESVALVAEAYTDPGFQFNSFRSLTIEGDQAEFQMDGYITDGGVRRGTDAQQAQSPPLHARFEGGRWRLSPDVSLLRLNQTRVVVE